jgi:acetyl coenzyme A synthetase (ADP forming)-like protein
LEQDYKKLEHIFNPKSVAMVGASNEKGKMGHLFMSNIITGGWKGKIYPINLKEPEVQGYKAFPTVKSVPEDVDLAIVVVPPKFVASVMKDCADKGVKGAVVITAGFKETGAEGAVLEKEFSDIAKKAGIRVVGPNCFGIYNCNTGLNASMGMGTPPKGGDISFATQSGAYGMAIFSAASDRNIRFAKVVAYGNKCDVDDVDAIKYFGEDPETKVIALFVESIDRGREFFDAACQVTKKKPVVSTKTGRSSAAARAATSHTGALAGTFETYKTAFKQSGIIFARTGLELIDYIKAFDWQPLPKGNRVGILTNSGGTAVELTDLCAENGLDVPEFPPDLQAKIKPWLLPFASAKNPIDLTPDWTRFKELYYKCTVELFESPNIDIVMPILLQRSATQEVAEVVKNAAVECQQQKGIKKPIMVCWVSLREMEKNQKVLEDAHIPVYEWPERTAKTAGALWQYATYLKSQGVERP